MRNQEEQKIKILEIKSPIKICIFKNRQTPKEWMNGKRDYQGSQTLKGEKVRTYLSILKAISGKHIAHSIFNEDKLIAFTLKLGF